jgi:hypothetical protein
MGVEPLEDTLPLPQIVRTMKNLTQPSYGRSCTVDNNSPSSHVDGSSEPSLPAREQEESAGNSGSSDEVCGRSERDRVWSEVEYLLGSLTRIKEQLTDGTDWDPYEVKWIQERYRLCRQQATHYVLCLNLSEVLLQVTFPGEKLTYLQIAERVVQGCNAWELAQAIREIGLNPHERVYHKVTKGMPVEKAEQILLTMLGDAEYVLAGQYPEQLGVSANSGWYKDLKKQLTQQGWVWKSKKIQGKVVQVIKR